MHLVRTNIINGIASISLLVLGIASTHAAEPVTIANYVRAESDHMIRANMEMVGAGIGKFTHLREPTTPANQPVIRMNRTRCTPGSCWIYPGPPPSPYLR